LSTDFDDEISTWIADTTRKKLSTFENDPVHIPDFEYPETADCEFFRDRQDILKSCIVSIWEEIFLPNIFWDTKDMMKFRS